MSFNPTTLLRGASSVLDLLPAHPRRRFGESYGRRLAAGGAAVDSLGRAAAAAFQVPPVDAAAVTADSSSVGPTRPSGDRVGAKSRSARARGRHRATADSLEWRTSVYLRKVVPLHGLADDEPIVAGDVPATVDPIDYYSFAADAPNGIEERADRRLGDLDRVAASEGTYLVRVHPRVQGADVFYSIDFSDGGRTAEVAVQPAVVEMRRRSGGEGIGRGSAWLPNPAAAAMTTELVLGGSGHWAIDVAPPKREGVPPHAGPTT